MATFAVGQQTDRAVLPQQLALEFASADTPGSRDETGRGRRRAPGSGHRRGETSGGSPAVGCVTPTPRGGERSREAHPVVFVLDKHGRPLQPTSAARARKLLKQGRAAVHRHAPFVIRLRDRIVAKSSVDGVELGIDPGSKRTGLAVFRPAGGETGVIRRGLYAIELNHRGSRIRESLARRAAYRRRRRSRNLRYRAPRFNNRTRPDGWLAPSLRHRIVTTMAWVGRLARWAPIKAVHVERVAFDTHVLSKGRDLSREEYQHGTLHGTEVREYLLAKWSRACAYCGATGVPLNIDHIRPKSEGGSDRISNLTLACIPCNESKSSQAIEEFLSGRPNVLAEIITQAKAPLSCAAAVNATRSALTRALGISFPVVRTASGGRTKWNRTRNGLPKTHSLDALCVGSFDAVRQYPRTVRAVAATGRGTYARTRADRYGFPRLRLPRQKHFFGFATGDYARASVPSGVRAGTHIGRLAVRSTGSFNIRTRHGLVQGVHHRHICLLQRADGYAYMTRTEGSEP